MKKILILLTLSVSILSCCRSEESYFKKLNARASQEYLTPVHPGEVDGNPFWNEFAVKFIYAPSFDIADLEGAESYRFDFWAVSDVYRNAERPLPIVERPGAEEMLAKYKAESEYLCSFTADSPRACIAPIWDKLPNKYVGMVVTAVDSEGNDIAPVGTREFMHDFPFHGPYLTPTRSYDEAILMALRFMDRHKVIQGCRANTIDERLRLLETSNLYACKFLSAAISCQTALAELDPENKDTYVETAHNAAAWLMEHAEPADAPLAYFPPTYYKSTEKNPQTMALEAAYVIAAFLDLYDLTGEKEYFDFALNITRTYDRIIDETGYIPKKLYVESGEGTDKAGALTGYLLLLLQRIHNQYGVTEFDDLSSRCTYWMENNSMKTYEMTSQFEDTRVTGWYPYQNMTNIMPNQYAQYLLRKDDRTEKNIEDAKELVRFVEDQFVHWDILRQEDGLHRYMTPGVFEQYWCAVSIDGSTASTAESYMDIYENTGDKLALEKARALVNAIVLAQDSVTGEIPTFWVINYTIENFWINCSMSSIKTLMRFNRLVSAE